MKPQIRKICVIGPGGLHCRVRSCSGKKWIKFRLDVKGDCPACTACRNGLTSHQYVPLQQMFVGGGKVRWGADAPVTSLDRYASDSKCRPVQATVIQRWWDKKTGEHKGKSKRGERKGKEESRSDQPVKPFNWYSLWCRLSAVIVSVHSLVSSKFTGWVRWWASAFCRSWLSATWCASTAGAGGRCRRRRWGKLPLRMWSCKTDAASKIGGLRKRTRSANRWWCTVHDVNMWLRPVCKRRSFSVFCRLPCMCQSLSTGGAPVWESKFYVPFQPQKRAWNKSNNLICRPELTFIRLKNTSVYTVYI